MESQTILKRENVEIVCISLFRCLRVRYNALKRSIIETHVAVLMIYLLRRSSNACVCLNLILHVVPFLRA